MRAHEGLSIGLHIRREGVHLVCRQDRWVSRLRTTELVHQEYVDLPGELAGISPEELIRVVRDALVEWTATHSDPFQDPLF